MSSKFLIGLTCGVVAASVVLAVDFSGEDETPVLVAEPVSSDSAKEAFREEHVRPKSARTVAPEATTVQATESGQSGGFSIGRAVEDHGRLLVGVRATSVEAADAIQAYIDALPEQDQMERVVLLGKNSMTRWGSSFNEILASRCTLPDPALFASEHGITLTSIELVSLDSIADAEALQIRHLIVQGLGEMEALFADKYINREFTITPGGPDQLGGAPEVDSHAETSAPLGEVSLTRQFQNGGWLLSSQMSSSESPSAQLFFEQAEILRNLVVDQQRDYMRGLSRSR